MKVFIQIPCLNESEFLPATLKELPRTLPGVDEVKWLVIDDGSSDNTTEVALANGVDYVVRFSQNQGLAAAFQAGIDAALKLGADIIVNTDADNQYDASAIPDLVKPIIDATSGFRAFSRDAALQINLVTKFTYTIESLIQVDDASLALTNVPVKRNASVRPSRLFGSTWKYVRRNAFTMIRIYVQYRPLHLFMPVGIALIVASLLSWLPWLIDASQGNSGGHFQSIILGAVFFISGLQVLLFGIIADSIMSVRSLTTKTLHRVREIELSVNVPPKIYRKRG